MEGRALRERSTTVGPDLQSWGVAAVLLSMTQPSLAESASDTSTGYRSAERVCGECHAVGRGETASPHPQAPPFTTVANAPGRTETSLRVWFQSPHRSMPDFSLGETDSNALVAYILSLKQKPR